MHFWWLELGLERIGVWTFEIYLFVICYAALFFFLGALLSRTAWTNIRGSPSISIPGRNGSTGCSPRCPLADLVDSAIKGADHFNAFGTGYRLA